MLSHGSHVVFRWYLKVVLMYFHYFLLWFSIVVYFWILGRFGPRQNISSVRPGDPTFFWWFLEDLLLIFLNMILICASTAPPTVTCSSLLPISFEMWPFEFLLCSGHFWTCLSNIPILLRLLRLVLFSLIECYSWFESYWKIVLYVYIRLRRMPWTPAPPTRWRCLVCACLASTWHPCKSSLSYNNSGIPEHEEGIRQRIQHIISQRISQRINQRINQRTSQRNLQQATYLSRSKCTCQKPSIVNYNPPEKTLGFLGFPGFPGIPGIQGFQGVQGVQGVQGFQGCQGFRDSRNPRHSLAKMENSYKTYPNPSKINFGPTKMIRIEFQIELKQWNNSNGPQTNWKSKFLFWGDVGKMPLPDPKVFIPGKVGFLEGTFPMNPFTHRGGCAVTHPATAPSAAQELQINLRGVWTLTAELFANHCVQESLCPGPGSPGTKKKQNLWGGKNWGLEKKKNTKQKKSKVVREPPGTTGGPKSVKNMRKK